MEPAIINIITSCPAARQKYPCKRWGGARNNRDRVTHELTAVQVQSLLAAWRYANDIGLPLNRHITIHFGKLGIADRNASRIITAFLKIMGDRLRKWGGGFAAIWVRENGDDKGSHVHIFAHIPPTLSNAFIRAQRCWLEKATNRRLVGGALHGKWIRGSAGRHGHNEALARRNGENVARYLVKGADGPVAAKFGLTKTERGGAIIGKRCGNTQNIGKAARLPK